MSETDMTEYAELLRHLRMLARGKHDDVSIAADAAGAIIALLDERDALRELTENGRWYSQETMDAVVSEREALRAEVERLNRILGRIVEGDGDSTLAICVGTDAFAAAKEYLRPNTVLAAQQQEGRNHG